MLPLPEWQHEAITYDCIVIIIMPKAFLIFCNAVLSKARPRIDHSNFFTYGKTAFCGI